MATESTKTAATGSKSESESETDDPYEIRPYEPSDRADFLELYDTVLGEADPAWFRWKYEDNPYTDHVPMIVAVTDGQLVGTKPCFALELRAGNRRLTAYQPADVMVHPDHRRQGLYSRTTERLKTHYADREPALFFNFPNEATLSGSLKHGWEVVEQVPTWYRIQRPDALLDADDRFRAVARGLEPLAASYLRVRDRTVSRPSGVSVQRYEDVPVDTFVSLADRAVPPTFHASRDETFYNWRFDNPRWEYRAYVASRHGSEVAGIITGTQRRGESTITTLTDVVPLSAAPDRIPGLTALLEEILTDRSEDDLLAVSGRVLPSELLGQFGFHDDCSFPLSRFSLPTTQVAYPIANEAGHEWTVADRAITDPTNWTVTFAEQDTS